LLVAAVHPVARSGEVRAVGSPTDTSSDTLSGPIAVAQADAKSGGRKSNAASADRTKRVNLPPGPRLSAAGVVIDATGQPIAGARVYLREWSLLRYSENPYDDKPRDVLAETKTDAEGRFAFRDVASYAPWRDSGFQNPWDVLVVAAGRGMDGLHLS